MDKIGKNLQKLRKNMKNHEKSIDDLTNKKL